MALDIKIDNYGRTFIVEACDNHFGSIDIAKACSVTVSIAAETIGDLSVIFFEK